MLQLLQQRTKLSGQIGRMKQRHGAVIYVPERERELLARLVHLSKGKPSAKTIAAVYREIMSSSRAEQGQAPIGLLKASAPVVLPASWACFGASDVFAPKKTWTELAKGLGSGALSVALLTGADLLDVLRVPRWRKEFPDKLTVASDFAPSGKSPVPLAERIFTVTPRGKGVVWDPDRILILIECKSTLNAIKSLLHSMPNASFHAEKLTAPARRGSVLAMVHMALVRPRDGVEAIGRWLAKSKSAGQPVSILGIYPATEDYGG